MMEVILLERIEKLGLMGEQVKVKPGFARNYLLPQGKALRATKENLARFEDQRDRLNAANLERRGNAEGAAEKLTGFICALLRQAGDSNQLYGSVTARDIAAAASKSGVAIARHQVSLERPIKILGIHPIKIALHPEVIVTISVNVARTTEEAKAQALASRRPAKNAESDGGARKARDIAVKDVFDQPETVQIDEGDGDGAEIAEEGASEGDGEDNPEAIRHPEK